MKKLFIVLTGIFFLLSTPAYLKAEEKPKKVPREEIAGNPPRPMPNENLRQAMGIRIKMRKIEEEAIKNDPELQQLQNQITELHKQLRTKLEQKLANDTEYKKLQEKLNTIKEQQEEKRQKPEEIKKKRKKAEN
ncbi:MAG TPA: hypothetical protein PLW95_02320 [bacterium]|mgnify:FL=1|nr:hypothetical protein [bacterium]